MNINEKYIIRSSDKYTGSTHDCHIELKTLSNKLDGGYYKMLYFSAVNSIYNINDENHTLYWNENAVNQTADIPNGIYTSSTLPAAIKTAMDAVAPINTYTVAIDSTTQRMTFSAAANFDMQFSENTKLASICGFAGEDTGNNTSHTGDYNVDLSVPRIFYIKINNDIQFQSSGSVNPSLLIPIDSNSNAIIYNNDKNSFDQVFKISNDAQEIHIQFVDQYNKAIDLNGGSWELIIESLKMPKHKDISHIGNSLNIGFSNNHF
jgi:hypothetical protein